MLVAKNPQLVEKGTVFGLKEVFEVIENNRDRIDVDLGKSQVLIEPVKINRGVSEAKLAKEVGEAKTGKAIQVNREPFLSDFSNIFGQACPIHTIMGHYTPVCQDRVGLLSSRDMLARAIIPGMKELTQLSLMEVHYREVEAAYPAAIQRLAKEAGAGEFVLGEVILAATNMDGTRFVLLCEMVGGNGRKIQISGKTVNGISFAFSNARFDKECLHSEVSNFTCPGAEMLVIEGDPKLVARDRYMTMVAMPSGTWGVIYAGHVDQECARISLAQYPDLYPGLTTVDEVANRIAMDFIRRQKAEIVKMVKNTWGE